MRWASAEQHHDERQKLEAAIAINCSMEPQFNELYAVLGNKIAQEKIRVAHPAPKGATEYNHCKHLRTRANACVSFPDGKGGFQICKNNPYGPEKIKARQEAQTRLDEIKPLVLDKRQERILNAAIMRAFRDVDLGIASLETLSPVEYILVGIKKDREEAEIIKAQAKITGEIMAGRVAQILSKIFSASAKPATQTRRGRGRRNRV